MDKDISIPIIEKLENDPMSPDSRKLVTFNQSSYRTIVEIKEIYAYDKENL